MRRSGGGWQRDEGGGSNPHLRGPPLRPLLSARHRGLLGPLPICVKHGGSSSMLLHWSLPKGGPGGPHLHSPTPPSLWEILPKHTLAPSPPPSPPVLCYFFGFTLLRFSARPRRQPAQGLFVNKLSINIPFWGKRVSFARRLLGPARWQEMGDASAPGGWWGCLGREEGCRQQKSKKPRRRSCEGFPSLAGSFATEDGWQSPPEQARGCGDVLLCKPFPYRLGWSESAVGLLRIQSNFAESNGAFYCCCCFLFLPLNFFGQWSTSLKCFNEEIPTAERSGDEKRSWF